MENKTMNHTPTPWKAEKTTFYMEDYDECYRIVGTDGEPVAIFPGIFKHKATTDFIVTACNEYHELKRKADAHEELVKALTDILATVEKQNTGMWFVKPANNAKYNKAIDNAKEALAKARVKS